MEAIRPNKPKSSNPIHGGGVQRLSSFIIITWAVQDFVNLGPLIVQTRKKKRVQLAKSYTDMVSEHSSPRQKRRPSLCSSSRLLPQPSSPLHSSPARGFFSVFHGKTQRKLSFDFGTNSRALPWPALQRPDLRRGRYQSRPPAQD